MNFTSSIQFTRLYEVGEGVRLTRDVLLEFGTAGPFALRYKIGMLYERCFMLVSLLLFIRSSIYVTRRLRCVMNMYR